MNVLNAVTRIVLTLAVILFLIIRWALVPYLTDASIDTPVVSIFLGNKDATSWTARPFIVGARFFGRVLGFVYFYAGAFFVWRF